VITLSGGVKTSAVCSFVSSQSTRVTDRQSYDFYDRASVAVSRDKNYQSCLQLFNDSLRCTGMYCVDNEEFEVTD